MLRRKNRRKGMNVVETALVISVFSTFFFGIFEYCRFLMVIQVAQNAARTGSRYAAVNSTCAPSAVASTQTAIINLTTAQMGGISENITGFQVAVYPVDPVGLALTPPIIRSKTLSTASPPVYPNPFNSSDANNPPWNSTSFGNPIAVTIEGSYVPFTPVLLFMSSSIPIYVTAMTTSEG